MFKNFYFMPKTKLVFLIILGLHTVPSAYASSGLHYNKSLEMLSLLEFRLETMKASDFIKLSVKDYSLITGKKLRLFEKVSFKIMKMKIKHDLKKNPNLLMTDYYKENKRPFKFNFLWFLIGMLGFAPIGLIIAYLTKQDKDKIISAWIGTGVIVILAILYISGGGFRLD